MQWKREEKAYRIHFAEAERAEAEVYNAGWGVNATKTWISIASKTSKGILTTNIQFGARPIAIEHTWSK